ncbi:WRKY DNA-binding transcription factor 70 isoform X1 [Musa acuminata AAA Group]|uniref:WRKY DNA-binding transcription factor 70 isoform X1 n=1 Tax=Musa acuminata AAA Group TaxID=214697 RepID=UPI0031CFD438
MENSLVDSVIREMEQAFELTTKLQSLVELGNYSDTQKESARMVSRELLQTCNATLSMLKSRRTNVKIEYGSQYQLAPREIPIRTDRRTHSYPRKVVTATPYSDGHQWRKYGEKKINGCIFPRSYYRCTYSEDQRCEAKKQVQQQDRGVPSLFLVIYKEEHTCKPMAVEGCRSFEQLQLPGCGEYTCNTSFPLTQVTASTTPPPVDSFSLRFDDSEDSLMRTAVRSITEGTIAWRRNDKGSVSCSELASADLEFLESTEPLHPSLSAVHDVDDEDHSPRSLGLDTDFFGFDLDDMELFGTPY